MKSALRRAIDADRMQKSKADSLYGLQNIVLVLYKQEQRKDVSKEKDWVAYEQGLSDKGALWLEQFAFSPGRLWLVLGHSDS